MACRGFTTWGGLIGLLFVAINLFTTTVFVAGTAAIAPSSPRRNVYQQMPHFLGDSFQPHFGSSHDFRRQNLARRGPPQNSSERIPLKITNMCGETIWPAVLTANGTGPGTGGFELKAGDTMDLHVGSTWKGRIWGRTNCSFDEDGHTNNPVGGRACLTGDCRTVLDCASSGEVPATLAEFTLAGGETGTQTFYDISLVDGYNLPVGLRHIPSKNTSDIPPNLTNAVCIATSGYLADPARIGMPPNTTTATNASNPIPLEGSMTNGGISRWCPWGLQAFPPEKPGFGVYPYPDDDIQRPTFDPCFSQCAKTNRKEDCCTDEYNDPEVCKPGLYSKQAKMVCPDAYSFAYDDERSTFIIPKGGGWEVIFCPKGRSTDILGRLGQSLQSVAYGGGTVSQEVLDATSNLTQIYGTSRGGRIVPGGGMGWMTVVAGVATTAFLQGVVF